MSGQMSGQMSGEHVRTPIVGRSLSVVSALESTMNDLYPHLKVTLAKFNMEKIIAT